MIYDLCLRIPLSSMKAQILYSVLSGTMKEFEEREHNQERYLLEEIFLKNVPTNSPARLGHGPAEL